MKALKKIEKFDETALDALLAPIWDNKEIINETGLVVGEDGRICLLATPVKGSVTVKNIFLDVLYEEGVDYVIEGNYIKRIAGGELPYFKTDEYFRKEPNAALKLRANPAEIEFSFPEERYIYFSEGVDCFERHIAVSYKTDKKPCEGLIERDSRVASFIEKLKQNKQANLLLYGDSITVGCNATGTQYGGNVSPYQPNWITLIQMYLQKKFGAKIEFCNQAVGGWNTIEGIDNFDKKCGDKLAVSDLFFIGFGANDTHTEMAKFKENITAMIDRYFEANPNGNVLLYSCLLPNSQTVGWRTQHALFEKELEDIASGYKNVGVAKVTTAYAWLEAQGKPTRDLLANNINHPNDFGVRVYAQVLLKTLLGEELS